MACSFTVTVTNTQTASVNCNNNAQDPGITVAGSQADGQKDSGAIGGVLGLEEAGIHISCKVSICTSSASLADLLTDSLVVSFTFHHLALRLGSQRSSFPLPMHRCNVLCNERGGRMANMEINCTCKQIEFLEYQVRPYTYIC